MASADGEFVLFCIVQRNIISGPFLCGSVHVRELRTHIFCILFNDK
jgi:hypothetical protein